MKLQDTNNQFNLHENLPAQNGQTLAAATLHDLPVKTAQEVEVKGGVVTIEYILLPPVYTSGNTVGGRR